MSRFPLVLSLVLILGARSLDAQVLSSGNGLSCLPLFQRTSRALIGVFSGQIFQRLGGTFSSSPQADGAGDGGGDGSGGDGGDGSGGDSGNGGGDGDGSGSDTGTVGAPGTQGDPGNSDDGTTNDNQAPADPPAVSNPTDPDDVADVPTNDPAFGLRGPGSPGNGGFENGFGRPVGLVPPSFGGSVPGPSVDVVINAVIVSGAPTPWEAIGKSPGVRNITVIGGIIALGETALANPPSGIAIGAADKPPTWLKFRADFRYLNGSVFPPVVPNVIDIRTISNTEEAIENPSN